MDSILHNTLVITRISVIIPNYNGSRFADACLKAIYRADPQPFEVIVVDDCSEDNSADIISRYPCRLIRLNERGGASKARNRGAAESHGNALFFMDIDCVVQIDTVQRVINAYEQNPGAVVGGSYSPVAYDDTFFSTFQSLFVHYSELKNPLPDYIAAHAMVMDKEIFERSGGFPEEFMPIIEDVEFSHRLKRSGVRLTMDRGLLVRHIFNYTFEKSLRNAFRKSKYWIAYSIGNRDITADSGTASIELKLTGVFCCLLWLSLAFFLIFRVSLYPLVMSLMTWAMILINRSLISSFFREKGLTFGIAALLYYILLYPLAVVAGGAAGLRYYQHLRKVT